jgi:hypothetical protein
MFLRRIDFVNSGLRALVLAASLLASSAALADAVTDWGIFADSLALGGPPQRARTTATSFSTADLPTSDELTAAILRRRQSLLEDAAARRVFLQKHFEPLERIWIAELEASEVEGLLREATELAMDLLRRGGPA